MVHTTPTPATAAGEAVLPHSQIHFRDAPLPTRADLNVTSDDWMLAGHDSYSRRAVILPACCSTVTASPRPLWYHSLGVPLLESPVISAGRLYLPAADGYLHVLGVRSGEEQWRVALGGELAANGLALAHDIVYVARDGHYIAALAAASGKERWRFDTIGVVRAAPLVVGRVLLVSSGANSLWCLDALTGQQYWVFHSEDALMQYWPTRMPPVVDGGRVYVALGASSEFNALDLRTGRKVWEIALPAQGKCSGTSVFQLVLSLPQRYLLVTCSTWEASMAISTPWPSSKATGAQQIGRLTNLMRLTVDTSWWTRYRSRTKNPDFGDTFPPAVPGLLKGQFPAIPRNDNDLSPKDHLQAIANTAGFHFAFIEQGGTSLYPSLAQRVTHPQILRILLSIGPTETQHFQTWQDKAGNAPALTDPTNGLVFPDLNSPPFGGEDFQTNLIMPEPTIFLSRKFPVVSIIRPTETRGAAMGALKALTADGLFIGQSPEFFKVLRELAEQADAARHG